MSNARADGGDGALLEAVRARIRRDGPMPVDAYMGLCLADPEHGYWHRAGSVGAAGDFITAPEISQVFGELIGLWCAVAWQGMGRPAGLRLVELGPGRGTLMADALRAAGKVPGFLEAAAVHLVEISAPLREMQKETLEAYSRSRGAAEGRAAGLPGGVDPRPRLVGRGKLRGDDVAWHGAVEEVPGGPAIVIANEFVDALPIRQLVLGDDGAWRERVVDLAADGALRFDLGACVDIAAEPGMPVAEPGAILELRDGEAALLRQLAARGQPVVALVIDYGPADACFGDTLQAVRRHAYGDPLAAPGRADLTAHVRFAQLARKARDAGLAADGPISQGEFLGRLGAAERAAQLMAANPARAGDIEAGVQRLLSPTGMGQLFKALAVRSPALAPPAAFG